ncbi:MAG: arsenate reductase ArsC [Nitrospira sp.]|nr:arsenate reductase ArsC [Nitrospira sp.]
MTNSPRHILVLCTGNSCRSIMGEALINQLGKGRYRAWSAGSQPTGSIHPGSIATLNRHGVDPGKPHSKSWNDMADQSFDMVITVCDQAAQEACPRFPGNPKTLHWSIPDPGRAAGTEAQLQAAFDEAFFLLKHKIEHLLT